MKWLMKRWLASLLAGLSLANIAVADQATSPPSAMMNPFSQVKSFLSPQGHGHAPVTATESSPSNEPQKAVVQQPHQSSVPQQPQKKPISDSQALEQLQLYLQKNPRMAKQLQQHLNQQAAVVGSESAQAADSQMSGALNLADIPDNSWQPMSDSEAVNTALAYRNVTTDAFPMTPGQIQHLRSMLDTTQRAASAAPYNAPPKPTSTSMFVNLSPGSTPPVIRLARGFVSSLVFIDSSGAPWPIESYDLGDPQSFNINWDKKNNTLMIQANSNYNYGNLAVKLYKLNTPVMLTLVPGQKVVDYRVDLRVQGVGPNAQPMIQGTQLPSQPDAKLLSVLDGISPRGATRLVVRSGLVNAWLLGNKMFIRSQYTLVSPAWLAKMASADGMNAYELQKVSTVLVLQHGKVTPIKIEGL